MLIVLAWFTENGPLYDTQSSGFHQRLRRFTEARASQSWRSEFIEGPGWGMFATATGSGSWNWDLVSRDRDLLVATIGLPVGLDDSLLAAGPAAVGRAALDGRAVFDKVVPPFGVLSTDGTRLVAQQDWFGMAPLYAYRSRGVVAFSNRPILLPYAFGDEIRPDSVGWAHYAACDSFTGSTSPVAGVQPLPPGHVMIGRRRRRGLWRITVQHRATVDDAASAGVALSAGEDIGALVLAGLSRVTSSLSTLWPGQIRCGLSGGRDSRLLAASLISSGLSPEFYTNTENPAEGETAAQLVQLARRANGRQYVHTLMPPRTGDRNREFLVSQRLKDHFLDYDFSCRRQSVLRGSNTRSRAHLPAPKINGVMGDIAWGIWVPARWHESAYNSPTDLQRALRNGLASKAGGALAPQADRWLAEYLDGLARQATQLRLDPVQSLAWMYCVSRARAWATPRNHWEQTMLYATPEFVSAVTALPLAQQQGSRFHRQLTARLLPEWDGVRYVHGLGSSVVSQPKIWDHDGMQLLREMAHSTTSQLTSILDRSAVDRAMAEARAGEVDARQASHIDRLLTTFAVLAAAEREFSALNAEIATTI